MQAEEEKINPEHLEKIRNIISQLHQQQFEASRSGEPIDTRTLESLKSIVNTESKLFDQEILYKAENYKIFIDILKGEPQFVHNQRQKNKKIILEILGQNIPPRQREQITQLIEVYPHKSPIFFLSSPHV